MTYSRQKFSFTLLFLLFTICLHFVSTAQDKKLTFDQVYLFRPPKLLDRLPSLQGWFDESHYLQKKTVNDSIYLMKIDAATANEEIFINYSTINAVLDYGFDASRSKEVSDDYNHFLFVKGNDLYLYSVYNNTLKQITDDADEENNPSFSPDGNKIAYTKNRDLYVYDINSGEEHQLTFDGSDVIYNGWSSWVYMEEILGRSTRHRAYWWSPNSKMIAFLHTDDSPVPLFPLFNAGGQHGELEWERYPKVGDPNPEVKLGIVHLGSNKIVWVDEDETIDQYTAFPYWTPDSRELFYQVVNRGQDKLDLLSADPFTGENKIIYTEKQEAWVEFFEDIYLFENGSGFLLRSDKDGWRHLYYYNMEGELISRLTGGNWNVKDINYVNEANSTVYFDGAVENSTEQHLYYVNLDGTGLKKLTTITGSHKTSISPGGKYFYDSYSNINQPPKLELLDSTGNSVRLIADSKTELFDDYNLGTPELFIIPTEDGLELPAFWVLPPDFDESKKYPVIFSIYGGPGFQDVKNNYSGYLNRFFVAQNDIIYFVVDHRGSFHFGKKEYSIVHKNLGRWELNDYIEAVKWLRGKPFVDETKIGITGGSYGGYMAALALTLGADYFTHGVDDAGVTAWELYDNVYTERYMETLDDNPDGYKYGSVMTHADKYKGNLLISHGTLDDNVHFQNALQLIDVLTDLDKDFELMIYPGSRHGVRFPKWIHAQRNKWNFWFRHFFGQEFERY